MFLKTKPLRWYLTSFIFTAILLLISVLSPQPASSQNPVENPEEGRIENGDPGSAPPPDLVLENPAADLQNALAVATDLSPHVFGSPVIVSPASFVDTNFTGDFRFIYNGYIYSSGGPGTTVCAGAPVNLPDGATILGVTAYAFDNDQTQDIGFWMLIKDFTSTDLEIYSATFSSSGADAQVRSFSDLDIDNPVVDNSTNIYYVYTCLRSGNHRLYAMQVDYTLSTFLPAISND